MLLCEEQAYGHQCFLLSGAQVFRRNGSWLRICCTYSNRMSSIRCDDGVYYVVSPMLSYRRTLCSITQSHTQLTLSHTQLTLSHTQLTLSHTQLTLNAPRQGVILVINFQISVRSLWLCCIQISGCEHSLYCLTAYSGQPLPFDCLWNWQVCVLWRMHACMHVYTVTWIRVVGSDCVGCSSYTTALWRCSLAYHVI